MAVRAASHDHLLTVSEWSGDVGEIACGFVIRDGETADLASGRRHVEEARA